MGGKGGGGGSAGSSVPSSYSPSAEAEDYASRYPIYDAGWASTPEAHFEQFGRAEGKTWGIADQSDPFAEFLASLGGGGGGGGSDYGAELEAQRERDRITAGENKRDAFYSDYLTAAGSATDFINTEISEEQSNANLLGIDYGITDEQKGLRINDYFASIWGEGEQSTLEGLIGEFGNPSGFAGYSVTRGDGSKIKGKEGSETSEGTSTGLRPGIAGAPDDEEVLGAGASILGA